MALRSDEIKLGDRVRFMRKGSTDWLSGIVVLLWWAMDEPAIKVRVECGDERSVFPDMGDAVEREA